MTSMYSFTLLYARERLNTQLSEMNDIWNRCQGEKLEGYDLFRLTELFCTIFGEFSATKSRLERESSTDDPKDDEWVKILDFHTKEWIRLTPQLTDQRLMNESIKPLLEKISACAGNVTRRS